MAAIQAKAISQLLKVLETYFWAQNDCNSRVYISTYNNSKLLDLPFSRNSQKTKSVIYAKSQNSKNDGFQPKLAV